MDETTRRRRRRNLVILPRSGTKASGGDHRAEVHRALQQGWITWATSRSSRKSHHDLAVTRHVARYGLPANLKLSIHWAATSFALPDHPPHCRSSAPAAPEDAGTTWLEELIGGEALALAKEIYADAIGHVDELCGPYAAVIDIDKAKLPGATEVAGWSGEQFTGALRHDQQHPLFNASFRQLLHVSFKLAAKKGQRYLDLLKANEEVVGRNVTENIYARHLRPLFVG